MLKPLILQTVESLRISLNEPLMLWLHGSDQVSSCTAKVATQAEWCDTLERIARMPPLPGDPSMHLLAKLAVLSASSAALEARSGQGILAGDALADAVLRDQILRECARARVFAERESPATERFTVRIKSMEHALRLQCGLLGPSSEHSTSPVVDHQRIA